MHYAHEAILIGGGLGLLAILSGLIAGRVGTPLLLVFLVLGMLAGEDGPGGIRFDDFTLTYLLGSIALAVILFEGGLKTSRAMIRLAWLPAAALATLGVGLTTAIVGAAAVAVGGVSWPFGLLLGALVAPTDAAAVAAVLRGSRVVVPHRVLALLELESGINDPMSVFLTVLLVELVLTPETVSAGHAAILFLREMGGGAVLGAGGGWVLLQAVRRLRLEGSLYPVLLMAGVLALFGAAQMLEASGFLAAYAAGVIVGNGAGARAPALERAFEAFGWVAQIGLFLVLGLLVTPHHLAPLAMPALSVAAALIFVARPLSALVCLRPLGFGWGETGFVGWVGLRGAVPIYLALIPVLQGVPGSELIFAAAFLIVLVSLAVQGWTIGPVARLMRLGA